MLELTHQVSGYHTEIARWPPTSKITWVGTPDWYLCQDLLRKFSRMRAILDSVSNTTKPILWKDLNKKSEHSKTNLSLWRANASTHQARKTFSCCKVTCSSKSIDLNPTSLLDSAKKNPKLKLKLEVFLLNLKSTKLSWLQRKSLMSIRDCQNLKDKISTAFQ